MLKSVLFLLVCGLASAKIYPSKSHLMRQASVDNYGKTTTQIHLENKQHLAEFVAMDVDDRFRMLDPDAAKNLKPKDAQSVVDAVNTNPVVSLWAYKKYDPYEKGIGFCFGRAMFVHLELALRGFDRDMIKKAFVIGHMDTGDGNSWGWHVTTIAQSKDIYGNEQWLALDPVTGLVTLSEWYKIMRDDFSVDKKLRIYVTESGKFGPTQGSYDQDGLSVAFYNNYFVHMMEWFERASDKPRYSTPVEEYNP